MNPLSGKNIVVLTGAGISQESGLKTFRDADGLWEGHRVEEVATPEAFYRQPELVHKFYNLRRAQLKAVSPNAAHEALQRFEEQHDADFLIVTQNIDDLHERAGSKNILHMHGEILKVRDLDDGEIYEWSDDLNTDTHHIATGKTGRLRPHICWFGEMPFFMDQIEQALQAADIFVAIGTSGNVYPAAGFVNWVPTHCETHLLNKEDADNSGRFSRTHLGPATEVVPNFFSVN